MHIGGSVRTFQIRPVAALRPYIDRIWGWESAQGQAVLLPTLLPGNGAEVFFHYRTPFCSGGGFLPGAHLLCLRRTVMPLQASNDVGFVAVRFRAGMLQRFTAMPGHVLMDQACSVADLWEDSGNALAERVAAAGAFAARARLIQSFLIGRLHEARSDRLVEHAISSIYRECAEISVERLAERIGIGKRQLERRFKAWTGQTPAEVRRLSRFYKTVRTLMLDSSARGVDAALAHGYYDQAHFIRDFQDLAQASPQRYIDTARARTHFYNTSWR